ncbi:hypothetical protein Cch01nite_18220 [Cellulomonas chitinilytica]|uniref:Uncharacterized protein n=1 Tax=Cellulomonas chitinilytica TaxID=398759 RepID=A0A919TZQ8_9CELL|nr:hypothetical protein Cch01nite_18220 [Cellulomonas chitinilytica]
MKRGDPPEPPADVTAGPAPDAMPEATPDVTPDVMPDITPDAVQDAPPPAAAATVPSGVPGAATSEALVVTPLAIAGPGRSLRVTAAYADLQLVRNTVLEAGTSVTGSETVRSICTAELDAAKAALEKCDEKGPKRGRRDAHLEFAWTAIHRARALLPLIVDDDALDTQYLYAVERVGRMQPRNARLLAALGTAQSRKGATPQDERLHRQRLSFALSAAYASADREHQQLRLLRDRLVRVAAFTWLALAIVVLAGTLVPTLFPLCSGGDGAQVCPTGRGAPSAGDVATVVFLGMIGAGLTAVLAVSRARPSASPYRLMPALSLLRIPLGGIVAVLGIVVMQSEVIPGFQGVLDVQQIAVYAIVFGFAQEAVTRLLENRVRALQDYAAQGVSGKQAGSTAAAIAATRVQDEA